MAPIWLSAMYRSTTIICEAISFSDLLCEMYRDPYVQLSELNPYSSSIILLFFLNRYFSYWVSWIWTFLGSMFNLESVRRWLKTPSVNFFTHQKNETKTDCVSIRRVRFPPVLKVFFSTTPQVSCLRQNGIR